VKNFKRFIGRTMFWLGWPVWYVYLKGSARTRVLITAKDKILVIRGWHDGRFWSLPGGGVHEGEKASASAIREVYEETGISLLAKQLKSLGFSDHQNYGLSFRIEGFVAKVSKCYKPKIQKLEILEAKWINPSKLNINNTDQDTLGLIATWKARR